MSKIIDKIKGISLENKYFPKLLSLLLAFILWAIIYNSKTGELKFRVPLTFSNLSSKLVVSKKSSPYIIAIVKGKNDYLKSVSSKNLKAVVDLRKVSLNTYKKYFVKLERNDLPENIQISLKNNYVKLLVEKKITKKIKITPDITGTVKTGTLLGKIRITPEYINITGAQSLLKNISSISTSEISIDGKSEDIKTDVLIKKIDGKSIKYSETNVKIFIPIISYAEVKIITTPIIIKNSLNPYLYTIKEKKVKIYFKLNGLDDLQEDDVEAYVNVGTRKMKRLFAKMKKGIEIKLPVKIISHFVKSKFTIISVAPEKVTLIIRKK